MAKLCISQFNTHRELKTLSSIVMGSNTEYEIFDNVPFFIAFYDNTAVGILSFIIVPSNISLPIGLDDNTESSYEAELTLYVSENHRKKGIAKELIKHAKKYILNNYSNISVVCAIPHELSLSSLAKHPAYDELLYIIYPDSANQLNSPDFIKNNLLSQGFNIFSRTKTDSETEEEIYTFAVSDDNDNIISSLNISLSEKSACLYGLYTKKSFRNKGLANALTQYSLMFFLNKNISVFLNVRSTNTSAFSLYKKLYFKELERVRFFEI